MNKSIKTTRNLFTHRIRVIKLAGKELQSTKFCTILLISVIFVGMFSLSLVMSSLINNIIISSTGRIVTHTDAPMAYKSEIRGMFVHCMSFDAAIDWDLIAQTCEDYGINVLAAEMLSVRNAYYPSDYRPMVSEKDELTPAIQAAHSRGIEFYVTMDVVYVPKPDQKNLRAVNHNGNPVDWCCPTNPDYRALVKNLVQELATKFDIDGFMFDYIRYDYSDMCFCDHCKAEFEQYLGQSLGTNWRTRAYEGGDLHDEFMEWRIIPINDLVRDIRSWMLEVNPDLKFSAAVWLYIYEDGQDYPVFFRWYMGQDWAYWVKEGWMDWVSPMVYTTDTTMVHHYCRMSQEYGLGGAEGKAQLVPFLTNAYPSTVSPNNFAQQVQAVRDQGCDGFIVWRYGGPGENFDGPDMRNYFDIIDMPDVFTMWDIMVAESSDSATITWTTDLPATSKIEYSTSPLFTASYLWHDWGMNYWDIDHVAGTVVEDDSPVTEHSIALTDLEPETKYYFRVQSADSGGIATSKVLTFTTPKQP